MLDTIFKNLNSEQQKAVKYIDGPSIIIAGAGSGKTRVLVSKVLHLINTCHVDPHSIVMITFTNKAAGEMKDRIKMSLGFVGTFHSFCAQILRRSGDEIGLDSSFIIYDEDDQLHLMKKIVKEIDVERLSPHYFINRISAAKNQLIHASRYLELFSDHHAALVANVYREYEKQLKKSRAVDFDDLIMKVINLFIKHSDVLERYQEKYTYILVDEFQYTNYAQYTLTRLLSQRSRNITVVGDFSQSIYSWRGADIRNLEKFEKDFSDTKVFNLQENYRSTQKILDFAYKVISKNQTHPILHLFTSNKEGEDIEFYEAENEEYEALYIADKIKEVSRHEKYSDLAVLYRTNAQSRIIEEAFLHYGIPYVLIGGTRFYERKEIKDVLSYLRLLINPEDEIAKDRILKIGKKKWESFKEVHLSLTEQAEKKTTSELMEELFQLTGYLQMYNPDDEEDYGRLENIRELKSVAVTYPKLIEFLEQVALVESEYFEGEKTLRQSSGQRKDEGVRLMTLHQAKGLEFSHVFIIGLEEGILPHSRSINTIYELEEERRLFYVGITRARKKLYITYARRRFIFGRRGNAAKSRFIDDNWDEFYLS